MAIIEIDILLMARTIIHGPFIELFPDNYESITDNLTVSERSREIVPSALPFSFFLSLLSFFFFITFCLLVVSLLSSHPRISVSFLNFVRSRAARVRYLSIPPAILLCFNISFSVLSALDVLITKYKQLSFSNIENCILIGKFFNIHIKNHFWSMRRERTTVSKIRRCFFFLFARL